MSPNPDSAVPARGGILRSLWPYAVVLAVGLFVLLPKLGDYGFWDPWEPKYAESAREMIERDSFIVPYYREEVRLAKPILVYWGILAGAALFGLNEFGARIAGVCAALAAMAGVFYAVSLLRGRQAGLIAALVLGTVPQFYFLSRQAMPDVYLFTSFGLSLLFFCLGMFGPQRRRNLHFGISYACIALAVLAKGPMIVGVLFLGTLGIWTLLRIDMRELWRPGRRIETAIFAGTAFPALAGLGLLGFTAYMFGTSPVWWGYSGRSREEMAIVRGQIQDTFQRGRLAEILLVFVAALAAATVAWIIRGGRRRGKLRLGLAALPALAAAAAFASLLGREGLRILDASLLGLVACAFVTVVSTRRFLLQEWLWPTLQPYLKEIGRQLVRFAVVFLVVAGPWHLAILVDQGHGYMTDFIIKHNVHRAGEVVNRSGTSEFYIRILIFGLFPWSCFLPAAIGSLVGWWDRNPLKSRGLEAFLLIASLITYGAFSSSATKFAHYLSPIIVPISVLIGLAVARSLEDRHSTASRLTWIVASVLFLLPTYDLIEDGSTHLVDSFTMKSWIPAALEPGDYFRGLLIAAGACLFLSILVRSRLLVAGIVISAALMANYNTTVFIPSISTHKTMKQLTDTWKRHAPDGLPPIGFFGDMKHGIFFYTEYRVHKLNRREQFEEFMDPARPKFCVIQRDMFSNLKRNHAHKYQDAQLYLIDDSHFKYVLISNFDVGLDDRGRPR